MHLSFLFFRIRASNVAHYFHTKKIIRFFYERNTPSKQAGRPTPSHVIKYKFHSYPFILYYNSKRESQ